MSITATQIMVLKRMAAGTLYQFRGDRQSAREVKRDIATGHRCDVNCRSIAPLMRAGFIEFARTAADKTRYYEVRVSPEGCKLLKELKRSTCLN